MSSAEHDPTGRQPAPANTASGEQSYPLVSLFVLVALCAILMGMITPLAGQLNDGLVPASDIVMSSVLGAILLSVVGTMVGIFVHRRLGGVFLGGTVGFTIGLLAGPMYFIPQADFSRLLVVSLGGAVLLLVVGAVVRLNSGRRHVSGRTGPAGHPLA